MQAKYVAAIGSSAGGLEALQQLLQCLRSDMQETAIVIAQHVSPSYQSRLVELLSKQTELPVANVIHGERPQGGRVYITPPDSDISFAKHRFVLTKPAADHGPRPSVDRFFSSLAAEYGAFCAAVILSGTGSDGSQGIGDVYDAGGLVIVQDSTTAKYGGMPDSAADTDLADIIASPEEIGRHLVQWIRQGAAKHRFQTESSTGSSGKITDHIIQLLSDRTGTDFSLYKPATIRRRLEKRLAALGIDTMEQYLELLHSEPGELDELFTTILIGVTSFFRDPESFELLKKVLRQKLEDIQPQDRFRAWVPGCATGEEAYSLAIIIADILQERRDTVSVQIFATDLDERALNDARRGIYPPSSMENVTPEIKERYFSQTGEEFEVSAELRSMVLFSRHDITANPPFLRLDLVSSRNLLIYFGQELQQYVLPLFHYALKPGGLLFLGKSETIGNYGDLFETHAAKHKIFVRRFGTNPHTHRLTNFKAQIPALHTRRRPDQKSVLTIADMVKDTLYHSYEHPYVVVNND
ncbi:MAG: CheR family methyltransferase, partial [Spirochaeta sp.]